VTYRDRKPTVVRLHDVNLAEDLDSDLTNSIAVSGDNSHLMIRSLFKYIRLQQIITHPSYRSSQNYNDIALLRLATDVTLSSTLYPACLWTSTNEAKLLDDQRSTVSACGFGVRSIESMLHAVVGSVYWFVHSRRFSKTVFENPAQNRFERNRCERLQRQLHRTWSHSGVAQLCCVQPAVCI
jgi:Trypsin